MPGHNINPENIKLKSIQSVWTKSHYGSNNNNYGWK